MIKTIQDIPNNETGQYLAASIGAIVGIYKGLGAEVSGEMVLANLNQAMVENEFFDPNSPPPVYIRMEYAVMALENLKLGLAMEQENIDLLNGINLSIKAIKLFSERMDAEC